MKRCPQCGVMCEDSDLVCKVCGYVFPVDTAKPAVNDSATPKKSSKKWAIWLAVGVVVAIVAYVVVMAVLESQGMGYNYN